MRKPELGHYRLDAMLGQGGMGEVWKAWDEPLSRWVALKFLKSDMADELARFRREAQTAAQLTHPNIAAVYHVGECKGRPFIAMQYVQGQTLVTYPRHDVRRLVELMREAALAVHFAHDRGVVHRDLKPANLMVDEQGRLFVMDFGLAKQVAARSSLSASGLMVGTPAYMPPEQARGESHRVDARSDVYSLGATLYELLADRPPFRDDNVYDLLLRVVSEDPKPLRTSKVGAELSTIVLKCLEKEPGRRYASARELADDLSRWLDGQPIRAVPPSNAYRVRKWVTRHRVPAMLGTFALVLLAFGVVFFGRWLHERRAGRATREKLDEVSLYVPLERDLDALRLRFLQPDYTLTDETFDRYDAVVTAIDGQMQRTGRSAHGFYLVGRCREVVSDFRRAERAYEEALRIDPTHARTLLALGRLRIERALMLRFLKGLADDMRKSESLESARHATEMIRRVESEANMELDLARAYLLLMEGGARTPTLTLDAEKRRWRDEPFVEEFSIVRALSEGVPAGAATLQAATARVPSWPKLWLWLGNCEHAPGRRIEALSKAIRINPRFGEAWLIRGAVHVRQGDHARGLADLTRAVELLPDYPPARTNRGAALKGVGDLQGALAEFTRALDSDPSFVEALFNRSVVRAEAGDVAGARQDAEELLRRHPDSALAVFARGSALQAAGDGDGALADFERAIAADSAFLPPWESRARLLFHRGDHEGALRDFTRAIELDPGNGTLRNSRAAVYAALGQRGPAMDDLNSAVRLGPRNAAAWLNRSTAFIGAGDYERALADAQHAIDLDPALATAYVTRGLCRNHRRDRAGAIEDYTRAIELDPTHLEAHANRAVARYNEGDRKGALTDVEKALELAPAKHPQRAVLEELRRRARE